MTVWGGLANSCEKREVKSKGEKEGYKHLNAGFQRIARRDKKAFLSKQCKEIEENNRMGKTRDLFKNYRCKGNISCKDGLDKGHKWYGHNRSRRYQDEISSLSHSVVFLYFFALMAEEGFLISFYYSLELCIQMFISFLFSFAFHFSCFHSYL